MPPLPRDRHATWRHIPEHLPKARQHWVQSWDRTRRAAWRVGHRGATHLRDRTDDQNSLLRNADRHHHVVENLHQNAHGVRKCGGARQAGRSRKAPRKICMSSRSAVAQRAARHQTAGNYHLNLNRHNQQQQCRHQQNARDVTRCVDSMGTAIVQNGTHKKPITLAPMTRLS